MREIKFRAWVKHTTDNRWNWAYEKADKKVTTIENNGQEVAPGEEADWRQEFLDQWDKEHHASEQFTIVNRMASAEEMSIYLNGKRCVTHGYEILEVMQFTGLRDKNGKEIYEGDILSYQSSPPYVVIFERARFSLTVKTSDGTGTVSIVDAVEFMEVIGNIYEHPHLLGGNAVNPELLK